VARTAEYFTACIADVLKSADLTPTQYNALRILRGAGKDGLACGDIGERMVTKDSDITRLLDRLERRGLISRERPENNRRLVLARLTAAGQSLLAKLDGPMEEAGRKLLAHLGKQRLILLNELLEACRLDTQ
jgi:DNA-binding MarR family transcriptional regulator